MNGADARARRCPRAIIAFWAWEAAVALLVAWPAASLVRAAYGADPRGDAVLWDPGAHPLAVLLMREAHGLAALGSEATLVLVGGALAGIVPTAALMVAMARAAAAPPGWANVGRTGERAIRCTPPFAILLVAAVVAQAVVVVAAVFLGKVVGAAAEGSLGEAYAHVLGAAVTAAALLPVLALAMMHDLARAAVVASPASAGRAIVLGVAALQRVPLALAWAWAWRALAGLTLVAGGAAIAAAVGPRGGLALLALALAHQGIVLARVALRASWLARALRTFERAP